MQKIDYLKKIHKSNNIGVYLTQSLEGILATLFIFSTIVVCVYIYIHVKKLCEKPYFWTNGDGFNLKSA